MAVKIEMDSKDTQLRVLSEQNEKMRTLLVKFDLVFEIMLTGKAGPDAEALTAWRKNIAQVILKDPRMG